MKTLAPAKAKHLYRLLSYGHGLRASSRLASVDRKTVRRYRDDWLCYRARLQTAYDLLWEGDGEGCDAITEPLPDQMVIAMLDAWLDDQTDYPTDHPLSGFHAGFDDAAPMIAPQPAEQSVSPETNLTTGSPR